MTIANDFSDFTLEEIKETLNEIRSPIEIAVCGNGEDSDNYFNSGGIIRTAHCFLVNKIHFIDRSKYYKKAAMGAAKYENIHFHTMESFLTATKHKNIIACERRPTIKGESLKYFSYPENSILIFGSERFGIPDALLDRADNIVTISLLGIVNDLNVCVAAGIILADWMNKNIF